MTKLRIWSQVTLIVAPGVGQPAHASAPAGLRGERSEVGSRRPVSATPARSHDNRKHVGDPRTAVALQLVDGGVRPPVGLLHHRLVASVVAVELEGRERRREHPPVVIGPGRPSAQPATPAPGAHSPAGDRPRGYTRLPEAGRAGTATSISTLPATRRRHLQPATRLDSDVAGPGVRAHLQRCAIRIGEMQYPLGGKPLDLTNLRTGARHPFTEVSQSRVGADG